MFRGETKEDDHDDTTDEFLVKATAGVAAGAAFAYGVYKLFTRSSSESSSTANMAANGTPQMAVHARAPPRYHLESSSSTTNMVAHPHAPPHEEVVYCQLESIPRELVKWSFPKKGWFKLNTDASCGHEKGDPSAIGGIIRDDKGVWKGGFSAKIPSCKTDEAELWAIKVGLQFARKKGFKKLEVVTDSEAAVQHIKEGKLSKVSKLTRQLIEDCRDLLYKRDWEVDLQQRNRHANSVANALANLGHDLPSNNHETYIHYYDEPPSRSVDHLLKDDIQAAELY